MNGEIHGRRLRKAVVQLLGRPVGVEFVAGTRVRSRGFLVCVGVWHNDRRLEYRRLAGS